MEGEVRNNARADCNREPRPSVVTCWIAHVSTKKSTVSKKFADHRSRTCVLGPPATHTHKHTHTHAYIYVWFNSLSLQFQLAFPVYTQYTRRPKHNTVHHVVMCAQKKHQQAAAQSESELQVALLLLFPGGKTNHLSVSYRHTKTSQWISLKLDAIQRWCSLKSCCLGDSDIWLDLHQNCAFKDARLNA